MSVKMYSFFNNELKDVLIVPIYYKYSMILFQNTNSLE